MGTRTGNPTWANAPATTSPLSAAALEAIEGAIDLSAPLASPALTGNPTAPTPATGDDDTSIATTAFVKAQGYATLASPAFTGNPTAPTPATSDSDTSVATTAYVKASITADVPELARDTLATALVAGTNVTITPDDTGDTITISATAGSAPDATTSTKGVVQLAGDLGGTAAAPTVVAASATVAGKVELATSAETLTGTDSVRAVTPAGLAATRGLYVGVNAQTGTTYAPVLTDVGKFVTLSNTGAITVTMPSDATAAVPVGGYIDFGVINTGMATFVAGSGATVNGTPSLVSRARWSAVTAVKYAANSWMIIGDLA